MRGALIFAPADLKGTIVADPSALQALSARKIARRGEGSPSRVF